MKLYAKILSFFAATTLACGNVMHADSVSTSNYGDLILGIYATGGTGSGFTLSVNLGEFTKYSKFDGSTFTVSELALADLNNFGASGNFSRTTVNWGVVGAAINTGPYTSEGTGALTPKNTLFATAAAGVTLNSGSTNAQASAFSAIGGLYTGLDNATATANSTSATYGSSANGDSWYALQTLSAPLDFGYFSSSITSSADVATLNLYELVPTNATVSTMTEAGIARGLNLLGSFNLSSSGVLTYTSTASAVKTAQTISFASLSSKTFGDPAFTLSASASSGLTVTFTLVSGPATLSGTTLTLTGAGTVAVRASQSGNSTYDAATSVDQSFSVAKASQTVTFASLPDKIIGDPAFTLNASSDSGLAPSFTITSGPASLSGNTLTITGTGIVTVRASQAGDTNYLAATSVDQSFSVSKASQTISFAALPDKTFGDASFSLAASSDSGLSPTFSIVSGPATLSGNVVTLTGAGTVVVRASQAGNTNYSVATPVDQSFTVSKASQTIAFSALPAKTFGNPAFSLTASASSGLSPTFSIVSGPATLSGSTLTLTGAGTVTVRASQTGDTNYLVATSVDQSFSVSQASQTIAFAALIDKIFGDPSFTLSASASSGLSPTFTIVSGPASLSGATLTLTGVGTVVVRASQAGNANYTAASTVDQSFAASKASQTISFATLSAKTFGDPAFTLTASASSGLSPTFAVVSGPATLSGSTLTLTGAGTVIVRASQSGSANYLAATSVDQSFTVAKDSQTISFAALPDKTFGDPAFSLTASADSGLVPTFSVVSGPASLSGSTLTLTGVGTVVVRASQTGNTNYLAAASVDQSFAVAKASQTISFPSIAAKTFGDPSFTLSASASSSLSPTFTVVSGPATLSGNTLTLTGVGTVVVRAAQTGNANYLAAASVDQSFVVAKASQTISFATLSGKTFGDPAFTLTASASSSLSPTFTVVSGPATLSGNTLTITGVGTVVVRASQAGNTNYLAATSVDQSFTVSQATQTISFATLASKTFGDPAFTLTASASSGLSPTFTIVSGPASLSGTTLTLTGVGTVVVRASQTGNASYSAATPVDQSFSIAQASQTISFAAISGKTFGDPAFTLSASASSSLSPTFTLVSGPATLSGNTLTITGAGTVVVRASQTGNTNYSAAIPVDQSFVVAKASQTISFATLSGKTFGDPAFTITASASSGLSPSFIIVSGPATLSGSTLTLTGVGTVIVRASQAGNTNYLAATSVDQSFTVSKATQTISFAALPDKTFGDPAFSLTASSSSGLSPTFAIVSGPATLSASTLTLTGVGTVVVRASQVGNSNYSAAAPVDQSFIVSKASQSITFATLPAKIFGDPAFTLIASASSGLSPTFTVVSGPATLSGSILTLTGAGTVTIRASQAGNTNYSAATSVDQSFTVSQATQTISFATLASKTFGEPAFTLTASASSGLSPTFAVVSGPATLSGSTLTLTGVGTVVVRASQTGNASYSAATPVDQSFTVAKATQTIAFAALSSKTFGDSAFTLIASVSSGLSPTFTLVSGPATLSGSTLTLTGVGTVVVRASQAGNTNYSAATAVDQSFAVSQASQTIAFAALVSKTFGDPAFTLTASASSGLSPTFTVVSGPATVFGSTLTLTGVGTVVVRASQVGSANYSAASPVDQSFSVAQASQTISFAPLSAKTFGDPAFTLTASASSGLSPAFSIVSGPAMVSGNTLTVTGAGTITVRASQSGNANYLAATPADQAFTVSQASQTISFASLPDKTFGDAAFTLTASASGGLSPTFTVVSGPATLSGSTLTLTGAGAVVVRASQSGNTNYLAATPVDQSFAVAQASQTISFAALSAKTFGDSAFTLSASASSGLSPTFTLVSGPATLSGSTLTLTGVGTVVVRASQAGNANYLAATPVDQSFAVAKASQSITFAPLPDETFGDAAFTLTASASSGLSPSFTIVSGPATLSGNILTVTGAGTVVVRASLAGNANYLAASPVDQSFAVAKAAQTISFAALPDKTFGDPAFILVATATSGLAPAFTIVSGPATISGSTLTLTGAGTVIVRAAQGGDDSYAAAATVDQSFSVAKASQTLSFASLAAKTFGDPAFTPAASASSGLSPVFTIVSGPATLSGNTLTITGVGTVMVRASQPGDTNYLAASSIDQSFSVVKAAQTISFASLTAKTFGDPAFALTASASSGLSPTFTVISGPASLSGSTLTITGVGTVVVRASQAGSANYLAASAVDQSFSVSKSAQTISFATLPSKTFGDPAFVLTASTSSGLSPTFTVVSGPATLSGSTLTLTGSGTVVVRASHAGNANYLAATPVDQSFTVGDSSQTITFAALPDKTFGDAAFTLSASASSGLTPTFSVVSGPATLSGNILTLTGAGTVVVRASQAGNANYSAASPVDQSFAAAKATQTISFAALPAKTFGDPAFALTASAASGLSPTFTVVSGPATLSGNTLTLTGAGTVIVRASQTGNVNYLAASPVDQSFTVAKASQTITFAALSAKTFGDPTFTLTSSASSSLSPVFSVVSGPATLSGTTLALTGVGTVIIRASQPGDTNYLSAATVDQSFTVAKASQTISFVALSTKTFGDPAFALTATSSSGLSPTFSLVSGPATLSGNNLTITGVGTITVRAAQSGNANYLAATSADQSFSVSKAAQTISFSALPEKIFGDPAFTLSASASSGLSPTFVLVSGPATLSGSTLTITGVGTVIVRASQTGDTNYLAATPVDQSFAVSKASQTISFAPLPAKTFGAPAFILTASASSSLSPTFTIVSGPATLSGSTLTLTGVGTVVVRASQAGNANYSAATPVDQTFTVSQASQTISFAALSAKTFGDPSFSLSSSASSGLSPSFMIVSGPATLSGSTITLTGAGTVIVRASQPGNANYLAATSVDQSFTVSQSAQTISFATLASKTFGDPAFTLTASASSGLSPTFTIVSGPATLSGNVLTLTGAGTVTVRASQVGNTNYSAATPVDQSFAVSKAAQTISFATLSVKTFGAPVFTLIASSTSGLSPSFTIVSGPATLSGSTLTLTGAGTVTVRASQAGNTDYSAAASVDQSFSVAQASQTLAFAALPSKTFGDSAFTLIASASSGLSPTFIIVSGPATLSGSTLTLTGAGTVIVRAAQAGNANYLAAASVDQSFAVAQAAQTISFSALPDKTFGNAAFILTATSSSDLAPTFSIVSGPASLSGNTITLTGVGTVIVRASQAGNTNYSAASTVDRSFAVAKASQTISFDALSAKTFGDPAFTLTASASSGLTTKFTRVSGPATLSGNTLTLTGAGTVIVRASQAGNANYLAAPPVDQAFTISQAPQTITFDALPAKTFGDPAFTLTASASSGLTTRFTHVSGPATLSGNTLTITGAGTVVVRASQSGNTNYLAAPPADQSFDVSKAAQIITFSALPSKTFGDPAFTLNALASSGLTTKFTHISGPATLSGNTLTLTGAGTVVIRASQSGNANYLAATTVDQSFSVSKAAQTISFATLPAKTFGDPAFLLAATSSSSLSPTFMVVSGPATLSGSTLTLTGAGTVVVRASQVGNTNYSAATPVDQSFTVSPSAQTISFATLSAKTFGDSSFTLTATSSSGLTTTFTRVSGPATLSGNTLTLTGAGTVVVRASQSGNANYLAATPVDQSFSVSKSAQTISFAALPSKTFGDLAFSLIASASSGLSPTFTVVSGPATLSGSTLTLTGSGTVIVRASQAGNANYLPATAVDQSFSVAQASQTISFATLPAKTFGDPAFALTASASSKLSPTFTLVSGPATLSGNTLTLTGAGSVIVRASQSGNANYLAATPVDRALTVAKAAQTISFAALPDKTFGDPAFLLTASSDRGLSPTFSVVSGPATLSGNTITLTGAGTIVIRASQSGNANYAAATPVDQTLTVAKASQTITFTAPSAKTYGDPAFSLKASASSKLAPDFAIISGPATVTDASVTLTGAGTVIVRASQSGNTNYLAAPPVDQTIAVVVPAPVSLGKQRQKAGSALSLSLKPSLAPSDLTYHATGLPSGLTLNPATGAITGTITATPGTYTVTYWLQLGETQGTVRTLTWTVDAFPSLLRGKFEGLFVASSGTALPIAKLELVVTNTGAFTGRLTQDIPGITSLAGQFTLDSTETFATLSSVTGDGYTIQSLKVSSVESPLTATLDKNTTPVGQLTDGVKLQSYTTAAPAPWTGAYTATFTPSANFDLATTDRAAPAGSGYATGSVTSSGILTLKGKLADGTAFTGSYATDSDAAYRIFAQPHGTAGNSFGGWIKLTPWATMPSARYRVASADGQDFYWNKPAKADDLNYRAGFGPLAIRVRMATWIASSTSPTLATLLDLSSTDSAKLTLSASDTSISSSQSSALKATAKLTDSNTLAITDSAKAALWPSLKLNTATGLVTGSIKVQDTATLSRSADWQGVILQLPVAERDAILGQGAFMLAPVARPASSALGGAVTLTAP